MLVGTVLSVSGNVIVDNTHISFLNGNTLYVGGVGPGNYTTIQEAVDEANIGDTVYVFNDSSPYNESVLIRKSICLIGENKESTIIDGKRDDVVYIEKVDGIIIKNFTLKNGLNGIYNYRGNNNSFENNLFYDNFRHNIRSFHSNNLKIISNILTEHKGIYFYDTINSIISKNNIFSCRESIKLKAGSCNNIISFNTINNSTYFGIKFIENCMYNKIFCNNFTSNIELRDNTCNKNLFYYNNFLKPHGKAIDSSKNYWYLCGEGNYWHDYEGWDLLPKDGIGDIPYEINSYNTDMFPLMNPYPFIKSRTIFKNSNNYNVLLLRFFDMFPVLQRILYLFH
jgi:hypothetical protein